MTFLRKWCLHEVADVRQRREDGERTQVIADSYGVTRNSLMGMMHRNGIGPPGVKPKPAPRRKKVMQKLKIIMVRPMETPTPPILEPLRSSAWKPLKGRRPIEITQLTRYRCHWPIGDPPFQFCGAPSHGCVYCPTHMKIGTAPKRPVERPPALAPVPMLKVAAE